MFLEDASDPSLKRGGIGVRVALGRGQTPGQVAVARELDVPLVEELVGDAVDDPRRVESYPQKYNRVRHQHKEKTAKNYSKIAIKFPLASSCES